MMRRHRATAPRPHTGPRSKVEAAGFWAACAATAALGTALCLPDAALDALGLPLRVAVDTCLAVGAAGATLIVAAEWLRD